jgi:hypothetical protein
MCLSFECTTWSYRWTGFATGEGQSLDAAFGHAQQAFMEWFEKIRIWRGLQPDGQFGADEAIASAWGDGDRCGDHGPEQVPAAGDLDRPERGDPRVLYTLTRSARADRPTVPADYLHPPDLAYLAHSY